MTPENDPTVLLSRALYQMDTVIATVDYDQAGLPTPCKSWNVGELLNHVMNDLKQFAIQAAGGHPDWGSAPAIPPTEWVSTYRASVPGVLDAWRQAGDLSGRMQLPGMGAVPKRFPIDQQITEITVHAWDLARATDQATHLDPELAQVALDWAAQAMRPEFRGDEDSGAGFGPEVPVPEDAPVYDRLAGFFGREPRWSAA